MYDVLYSNNRHLKPQKTPAKRPKNSALTRVANGIRKGKRRLSVTVCVCCVRDSIPCDCECARGDNGAEEAEEADAFDV